MTLDDAIKNFEQEIGEFEGLKRIHAVTHEDYVRIEKTKQLAEWLKELKELRAKKTGHRIYKDDDNQEAIEELQLTIDLIKQNGKDWLDERDIPILSMAIEAMKDEIPKKPIEPDALCPICKNCVRD